MNKPIYPLDAVLKYPQRYIETLSDRELMLASGQATFEDTLAEWSSPIDMHLRCQCAAIEELKKKIIKLLHRKALGPIGQTSKFSLHLEMLLSNIFLTQFQETGRFIAYSRLANDYSQNRYNNSQIGYRPTIRLVGFLESLGLVEHYAGSQSPGAWGRGLLARFRGTTELFALASSAEKKEVLASLSRIEVHKDSIRLKNHNGKLIDYPETAQSLEMRSIVDDYNRHLSMANIRIDEGRIDLSKSEPNFDPEKKLQCRIFNNGSFDLGGRFYGSWWQDIPRTLRSYILINEEQTVELDFSAMVAHQAYSERGICYWDHFKDDDPYELEDSQFPRSIKKLAFHCALNCRSLQHTISAIIKAIKEVDHLKDYQANTDSDFKALINAVASKHHLISDAFFSCRALEYQNQDSRVCESIIRQCTLANIIVLTVHDSFIVAASNRDALEPIMLDSFRRHLGSSLPHIKVI